MTIISILFITNDIVIEHNPTNNYGYNMNRKTSPKSKKWIKLINKPKNNGRIQEPYSKSQQALLKRLIFRLNVSICR
uniref:Uncharacterized protein n=1 Tax=Solanum lycopersicum TaxID=4081 RepID=A0A3Q7IRA5_SOLLC